MADSERLVVLKALTDHLKGITPVNGYEYDLSDAVFRGRTLYGENDPLPMISILESAAVSPGLYGGTEDEVVKDQWPLLLQGFVEDDVSNPTDPAYNLMAAVERRLAVIGATRDDGSGRPVDPAAYLLGGLIGGLQFGPGVVRPPMEQVSSKAFFYLPVRISLAGNVG